ncbi:MAG TPA: class A beta-lactamase-related serine hydrolase [Phaeodactylibacter sp.]|nr:class A beta-lactamase-related serine hydrolase [Phaeodactylibacter sp.]
MKKHFAFIILSIFLISNILAQDRTNLKKEIDKIIHYDTEIEYSKTPGFVVAVKVQDSIFYFGYGSISKEKTQQPNENTIFEIGGLTKSFTASLVSLLVAEGKMEYEKSFNSYLPNDEKNEDLENLTIDQLLTHTSGMPRMPLEFGVKETEMHNPYAHYTQKDLMDFYKIFIPIEPKKKKRWCRKKQKNDNYLYSHLNYALLERAIAYSQHQSFENLLEQKITRPLHLMDTKVQLSEEQQSRLATGYTTSGAPTPPWKFQSFKASEGLKSTAKDLIHFAEAQMGCCPDFKAFEQTHLGKKKVRHNKRVEATRGWHIISTNKKFYDVIAHSGTTNGHRAYLAFVKETDTAVVVLSNSEHGMQSLGYLILQMVNNYWKKW